jgi:hypothetical protein
VQVVRAATDRFGEDAHEGESRTIKAEESRPVDPATPRRSTVSTSREATGPRAARPAEREPVPEVTPGLAGVTPSVVVTSVQPAARVVSRGDPVALPRERRRGVRLELTVGRSPGSLVESAARGIPSPAALGLPAHPAAGGGIRFRGIGGSAPPAPYAAPLGRW